MSFCFLYNVVSENYSVQNSPWGGGEGGLLPAQGLTPGHVCNNCKKANFFSVYLLDLAASVHQQVFEPNSISKSDNL